MYINRATIYGNLTRDPEVRALPSGQQAASFSVATNRTYKDRDGNKQEVAEFHNVVAFGRLAEIMGQYLKKGRPVYIEGRLQTRSWDKDGQKQYRTEIVVENFQFGPGGGGEGGGSSSYGGGNRSQQSDESQDSGGGAIDYPAEEISPDDIPF